jgi:photosystem II stability/assembly factor-like uncharacterized protein
VQRVPSAPVVTAESANVLTAAEARYTREGDLVDTRFWRSTDGGRTWVQAASIRVYVVRFVTGSVGFAAGDDGVLYRTRDGGRNWAPGSFAG